MSIFSPLFRHIPLPRRKHVFTMYYSTQSIKEQRRPKKKVALLVGFNGSNYQGMQLNPGIRSIERDLFDSLCKAGAISQSNAVDPKKVQWLRAARTDKGVHAVGNVVSLKMIVEDPDVVDKTNHFLPDQIRVWGYVETQNSFHAKNQCDSRKYEYLLPTYTLMPPLLQSSTTPDVDASWNIKQQFRISKTRLDQFSMAMDKFMGTHRFHNYTIGRHASEMYAQRHIKSIKVDDPLVVNEHGGMEWIRVHLHGQSFMLHQIRKMIAMALLTVRTDTPLSIIDRTFEPVKINIPKAPSLGLLLDRPVYDHYNGKIDLQRRQVLDFDKYKTAMDQFKTCYIDNAIFEAESEQRTFDDFLQSFDDHYLIDSDFGYLNPDGIIPSSALICNTPSSPSLTK
ncbi:unnamed protein product [Absidia cylindrospora]